MNIRNYLVFLLVLLLCWLDSSDGVSNPNQIEAENRPKRTIILGALFKKLLWAKLSQFNNLPITRRPNASNNGGMTTPMPMAASPPAPMQIMTAPTPKTPPPPPPPPPPPVTGAGSPTGPATSITNPDNNNWIKTGTNDPQAPQAKPQMGPIYYDYNSQEIQSIPPSNNNGYNGFSINYPGDENYNNHGLTQQQHYDHQHNNYYSNKPTSVYQHQQNGPYENVPNYHHHQQNNDYYETSQQYSPIENSQSLVNFPHHHHHHHKQHQDLPQYHQQLEPVINKLTNSENYINLPNNNHYHQQQYYGDTAQNYESYNNGATNNQNGDYHHHHKNAAFQLTYDNNSRQPTVNYNSNQFY